MTDETQKIIERTAKETARQVLNELRNAGKIKYHRSNAYNRTTQLLLIYPNLPEGDPVRMRIDKGLEKLKNNDYVDVLRSYYFDRLTVAEIAEIYDCADRTIAKKRNQLVKALMIELFPEDIAKEIFERG